MIIVLLYILYCCIIIVVATKPKEGFLHHMGWICLTYQSEVSET